jgi:hypothetical protein
MSAVIDTHKCVKDLINAGFEERQAEGVVNFVSHTLDRNFSKLANKDDIVRLEIDITRLSKDIDIKLAKLENALTVRMAVVMSSALGAGLTLFGLIFKYIILPQ